MPSFKFLLHQKPEVAKTKAYKEAPQIWPKWLFLGIRALQVAFAAIPMGIAGSFILAIGSAGYGIPFQLAVMVSTGAATIATALSSAWMMWKGKLKPVTVMTSDGILIALWVVVWASLAAGMKSNLVSSCTKRVWGDSVGVRVCNSYKSAFTFSLISCFALGVSLALAIKVRKSKDKTKYAAMRNSSAILLQPPNVPGGDTSYPDGTQKTFMTNTTMSNPFAGGTYRNSTMTIGTTASNPFAGGTMRSAHTRNDSIANPEFTYHPPAAPSAEDDIVGPTPGGYTDRDEQDVADLAQSDAATAAALANLPDKKIG